MFTNKNLHLGQHLLDYEIYQIMCPFKGFSSELKKNSGVKLDTFIIIKKKRDLWFYIDLKGFQKIGKKYLEFVRKKPQNFFNLAEKIIYYSKKLFIFSDKISGPGELKKISDSELNKIYNKFHILHHTIWSLAMVVNLLEAENNYLTDYVLQLIKKNKKFLTFNLPAFEILNIIVFFNNKTILEQRREDYYNLLISIKKFSQRKSSLINKFYNNYSWMEYNWSGPAEDKAILMEQIKKDLKKKINYNNKLKSLKKQRKDKLKLKEEFFNKMNFSANNKILIKILENIYYSKGFRMNASYFAYCQMERVFKEIGRRLNLSVKQARSILPYEMKKYLVERKIDEDKINNLYNKSVIYWDGKKEHILVKKRAENFINLMTVKDYTKNRKINILRGQVAFRGKVMGEVKVINQRSELKKFKKGNILVSGHTDPSLMPAIRKAAAIVTNFGGMTCHAAIISRELKIPCVIGTRIATKVLKDGDRVEVDANKGVVKKLNR